MDELRSSILSQMRAPVDIANFSISSPEKSVNSHPITLVEYSLNFRYVWWDAMEERLPDTQDTALMSLSSNIVPNFGSIAHWVMTMFTSHFFSLSMMDWKNECCTCTKASNSSGEVTLTEYFVFGVWYSNANENTAIFTDLSCCRRWVKFKKWNSEPSSSFRERRTSLRRCLCTSSCLIFLHLLWIQIWWDPCCILNSYCP